MGEVYRARDPRLDRDVAIKVLLGAAAEDPERLSRFEREARAASALNHPNILIVHDVGSENGRPYLVTELLEGESLRELLDRGPLKTERALQLGTQIARGLAAAHGKGLVHRDLKPGNLFLTRDGAVKILDFGLAKLREPLEGSGSEASTMAAETAEGILLGTFGYMAPEQLKGEPADAMADIFAFGCVFYELLSGRQAFQRDSAVETMSATLQEEPPELAESGLSIDPQVERVLRHCLEKKPEDRFQSTRDLVFDLESARESSRDPTSGSGVHLRPKKERRHWGRVALLSTALLIVLVIAGIWVFGVVPGEKASHAGRRIDSLAVLPLTNLSGDPEQEYFADGMTEALIAELAKLRELKIISRTSVMQYKGAQRPLPEIAQALGVRGIVEGSVLSGDDQIRVTVQLIDAASDSHLWAESYTREARDVLSLQSEVARGIAREIQVAVSPEEERALTTDREVDPEAHRLVLQAIDLNRRGASQAAEQERIRDLVDRALELAPDFALAHALRARVLMQRAGTGYLAGSTICPPALREIENARALDPESNEARLIHAWVRSSCDLDWSGAERDLRRLVQQTPGDAVTLDFYAGTLSQLGRHNEALEYSERAFELDPLNDWIGGRRVLHFMSARRYEEAIAQAEHVLEFFPDSVFVKWGLGNVKVAMGDYDGAIEVYLSRKVRSPGTNFMVGLAHALAGRQEQAREVLDFLLERRQQRYVPGSQIAVIYGGLGELDHAFEWLDRAYEERDYFLGGLKVDPMYDPLREDLRFAALLERMNFPQ
jgi:serine/threonine protein kinase